MSAKQCRKRRGITWTTTKNNTTYRIGSVTVRYVDENGLNLDTAETFTEDEMSKWAQTDGGIIKLSDWGNRADGTSRVTGYTYDHATLRSRDGQVVTGLKTEKSVEKQKVRTGYDEGTKQYTYRDVDVTVYRLCYTTDENVDQNSNWTVFKDYGTDTYANNSFVYLVFKSNAVKPVTIHYMTLDGKPIKDSDGKAITKTVDATSWGNDTWKDLAADEFHEKINGYEWNSTYNTGNQNESSRIVLSPTITEGSGNSVGKTISVGEVSGSQVRAIKYTYNSDNPTGGTFDYGRVLNNSFVSNYKTTDTPDIYLLYKTSNAVSVTVHRINSEGETIADDITVSKAAGSALTLNDSDLRVDGHTISNAYINWKSSNNPGTAFSSISYSKQTGTTASDNQNKTESVSWKSTVTAAGNDPTTSDTENLTTEVWVVYDSSAERTAQITLHYQYVNKSGTYSNASYKDGLDTGSTKTITVTSKERNYLVTDPDTGDYVNTIYDGKVFRPADTSAGENEDQHVMFMSSHLAGADGPTVTSVDVSSDGKLIYHTSMSGTADPDDDSANPTSWTLSQASGAQKGRSVTITKGTDGYLKLIDSLTGDIPINLVNDEAEAGSDVPETYKGTLQNGTTDVDYVVSVHYFERKSSDGTVTRIPRYGIDITNSYPSTSTDVYQVYIDGNNSADKIWIEDDMKYTGLFRLDVSDSVRSKLENKEAKGKVEWHRITVPDSGKSNIPTEITDETDQSSYPVVTRKRSGEHWNIALDADQATWLDIEADEGNEVWQVGTTHAYYAKLTFYENGVEKHLYSRPLTVNYYGQLENGSFETPVVTDHNTGDTSTGFKGGQTSNEWYENNGGVWQTTGPGSSRGQNYAGRDIEIVNGTDHIGLKRDYHWLNGDDSQTSWAADGNQFAELNAENAGALYQDVITHPNENINFWVSHRARGSSEADGLGYKLDTMYVVIMPTKLAMTMGDDGTELQKQTELQKFISSHGGFDSSAAYSNDQKLTYYDEDSGILVYKISSGENAWHTVNVINNYKAKGGLTRFFFCAASTAGDIGRNEKQHLSDPPTQGNFIDNVGFNQSLPPTTGFNLTVTETFSGITMEQLAGLASNANDYNGKNGISAQTNPLKVTLTNSRISNKEESNDALSGAKLAFTMGYDNDQNLVLTPTATMGDGTTSLFELSDTVTKPGFGDVHQYSDGRIVITWEFPDQLLHESGNESTDQRYNYTANDNLYNGSAVTDTSTTDINGFSKTSSRNAVDNKATENNTTQGTSTDGSITTEVSSGADKTLNIVNVYSPRVHISVRKTFSGVTPTTVDEMMRGTGHSEGQQYSIKVTKTDNPSDVKVLKVDGGYASDGTKDNTVSVTSSQGSDGSTTYKWTIIDPSWQDATYSVKEENYKTNRNTLFKATLNGTNEITTMDGDWPSTDPTIEVSGSTTANMTFSPTAPQAPQEDNQVVDLTAPPYNGSLPDTAMSNGTNLVIGQYTLVTTEGEGESQITKSTKKYVVWTSTDVGLTTRRAIISKINTLWTDPTDTASSSNTMFVTGDNAYVVTDGRIARMVNRQSASLTGQGSDDTWNSFYAAKMTSESDNGSEDESEIRIDNEYTPKIKIQKQNSQTSNDDGSETHERLNGAVFRLYKKDGNTKLYYQKDSSTVQWNDDANNAKQFTTEKNDSEDGIAILDVLPADGNTAYYLEEYKAPAGYQKISDIEFKVRGNGTVTLVDSNGTDRTVTADDKVQVSFIDPYYTFIINDDPGTALPNTGGPGTRTFIFTGLALVLLAGTWLGLRSMKKRQIGGGR